MTSTIELSGWAVRPIEQGVKSWVAIDRTFRTAPDHRLAHLMLAVMATGMPPADLDTLTTL